MVSRRREPLALNALTGDEGTIMPCLKRLVSLDMGAKKSV